MALNTHLINEKRCKMSHTNAQVSAAQFPPLDQITRPTVTTEEAAYYLNRKPQTLRNWACFQPAGVPRPIRIQKRLGWKVSDIRALLNGGAA